MLEASRKSDKIQPLHWDIDVAKLAKLKDFSLSPEEVAELQVYANHMFESPVTQKGMIEVLEKNHAKYGDNEQGIKLSGLLSTKILSAVLAVKETRKKTETTQETTQN